MSKVVDQKVVEMQFDNRHFERNVATTMTTLEKLKKSLKLPDASKSLDGINHAAKNVNLSGIGKAVDTVNTKFSALEVMGVTALANITNSAVNAEKRIVAALTIDPVKTGFQEYELKMGSIQTIMASTGESLDTVNQYLEELNEYSDKTIYSFQDMTQNIGKFTNAGVKLDDAVMAIKGISNEAAVSGANANEASRAMYNFAQALSAGYVKLIDWKSIENANMATVEFKNQLIETAVNIGTVTKGADGMYKTLSGNAFNATKNFNEVLKDEWMTTEVLVKTLRNYADETTAIGAKATAAAQDVKTFSMMMDTLKESAQSGWARTWEIIVGDYDESKSFFTMMSKAIGGVIDKMSDIRNDFFEEVLSSPWEKVSKEISNSGIKLDDFKSKLKATAKAHNKELAKMSDEELTFDKLLQDGIVTKELIIETLESYVQNLDGIGESAEDMTEKLKYFQKVVDQVWHGDFKNGAERMKALADAGYEYAEVQALVNKTVDGHKLTLEDLSDAQLKAIGYTDEQVEAIHKLAKEAKDANTPLSELLDRMNKPSGRQLLLESLSNVLKSFTKPLNAIRDAFSETFGDVSLSDSVYKVLEAFHALTEKMIISDTAAQNLKNVFEGVFASFKIGNLIVSKSLVGGLKILDAVLELIGTDIGEAAGYIAGLIKKMADWLDTNVKFLDTYDKVAEIIVAVINGIKKCIDAFKGLPQVSRIIKNVEDTILSFFSKLDVGLDASAIEKFVALIESAFNRAAEWISSLKDSENLGRDLVQGLINGLTAGVKKVVETVMNLGKTIIEAFCEVTGIASPSKVFYALGGFIIAGLIAGLKDKFPDVWDSLKGFGAKCIEVFKNINFGQVLAAGLSVGLLFTVKKILDVIELFSAPVTGFGKMMSGLGSMFENIGKSLNPQQSKWTVISKAILNVALSIAILTAAAVVLGKMEADELKKAGLALAAMIGAIAVIMLLAKLMSKISGSVGSFTSVVAIAGSLLLMSLAMKRLTDIDVDGVEPALKAMGLMVGSLAAVLLAFGLFTSGGKAKYLHKAGTMLVKMTVALLLMTGVLKVISMLTDSEIDRGMTVVAKMSVLFASIIALSALTGGHASKVGTMLLKMSAAMLLMVGIIKLAAMLDAKTVEEGLKVIAMVSLLFAGIVAVSALAGPNASKAGTMILAMAVAFAITVYVIKQAAELDKKVVAKGILIMADIALLFAALIAISQLAGDNAAKAGLMLLMMAGAMAILTALMYVMSKMDPDGLARAVGAVTMIGLIFGGLIAVTSLAKDCKATLIAITVAISILVVALVALSFVDTNKIMGATAALTILMGMFALIVLSTKNVGGATKTLIAISAAVAIIGGVLYLLSGLPIEASLGATASLSILMLVLAGVMKIIEGLNGPSAMALVSMVVVTGVVAALGLVLKSLQTIDPVTSIAIVGVITAFLAVLLVALLAMQFLQAPSVMAVGALAVVTLVVVALAAVLYAMQSVDPTQAIAIVGVITAFLAAMLLVVLAASAIGPAATAAIPALAVLVAFIGALGLVIIALADLAMDVIARMPQLGTDLSNFMKNAQPFIDGVQNVPNDIASKVGTLCDAIGKLTTQELWNSIKSFFSGGDSLADMGAELKEFGECIGDFATNVNSVSIDSVINSIKELINMDFSGLDEGLDKFRKSMETLAEDAVESFAKKLSSSDSKAKAKKGAQAVIDAASEKAKAKTAYTAFYDAGEYLIDGLAAGIRDNKSAATNAAQGVADAVEAIIRAAWKVNSPSKVFYDIALGIGEGIVNGVTDSGNDVYRSANVLADRTTKSFSAALSTANDIINNSMDVQPTISPVLDLSNVESGVGTLNGMLGSRSVGINAHIGAISSMMGARGQNGVNGDVVSAINKLRGDLGKVGNTYNSINGITYDDGSNVSDAVKVLVRAAKIERRV